MINSILFDCDGVLVDSEKGLSEIAAGMLNHYYGLPATPEDFAPFIGMGEDAYLGGVVRRYHGEYTPDVKAALYREYLSKAKGIVRAFDGVVELLLRLRADGYKLAVASSADDAKVGLNLDILGLRPDFFDLVVTGSMITKKKPDPEIYLTAARGIGSLPSDCIIVEDAISGVMAGCNAGIRVIGLTSSVASERLLAAGAESCMDDIRELLMVLK
jgi:beta-phosphoglucomutase